MSTNCPAGYREHRVLNLWGRNVRRKPDQAAYLIAGLVVITSATILSQFNYSNMIIAVVVISAVLGLPLMAIPHELSHFAFQWLFSHQMPRLGFHWPYPYSALSPGTHVSRNQGIVCALAPSGLITPLCILLFVMIHSDFSIIALVIAGIHIGTCTGDYAVVSLLARSPRCAKLVGQHNLLMLLCLPDTPPETSTP